MAALVAVAAPGRDDSQADIARIAAPVLALGLLRAGAFVATSFWAARLPVLREASIAALGGAALASWMVGCLGDVAGVGTQARIARAVGARDRRALASAAIDGLLVAALAALALMLGARLLGPAFVTAVGFSGPAFGDVRGVAEPYVVAVLALAAPLCAQTVLEAIFRGLGDTRTALFVAASGLLANVLLEGALMVRGGLGLIGAAYAGATTAAVSAALLATILHRRGVFHAARPTLSGMRATLRIGGPPALSGLAVAATYLGLGQVISAFGPAGAAGIGVGQRIEAPAYQVCAALGVTAATLVGQRRGEGNERAAARVAHGVARLAAIAMGPFALVFICAPDALTALLGGDESASAYVVATGLSLVPMALEIVYENAFAGAAASLSAMIVAVPLTALRVPIALLAVHVGAGLPTVFAIIAASTTAKGVMLSLCFRSRFG